AWCGRDEKGKRVGHASGINVRVQPRWIVVNLETERKHSHDWPIRRRADVWRIAFRRARLFEDYGWYFAKARTALWPPKPKLLLRATSTWWLRARLGM